MGQAFDAVLVLAMLLNFLALGTSRLRAVIRAAALQGVLLALLPLLVHGGSDPRNWALAVATIALKGIFIPAMLHRAMRSVNIRRDVEPVIGYVPALLVAAVGTGLAMVYGRHLPLMEEHGANLAVPASFSTVFAGFLVLVTRTKAITQVVGYLMLENGVFIFGMLLLEAMPFLVEVGVLLDLFVAVFVMGILMNQIQRTFLTVDTVNLSALREE